MVLALDISTAYVGWCIMDDSGSTLDAGAIELKKIGDMFAKAEEFKKLISEVLDPYDVRRVAIEENLQAFRPGFSSAKTICTLSRFNGMVSYIINEITHVIPEYINVNHARKTVGLKIRKKDPVSTKDQVLIWVKQNEMPHYDWPNKTLKSGKRKGIVIPHESCYDIADAFVIGKSCVINGRRTSTEKKS